MTQVKLNNKLYFCKNLKDFEDIYKLAIESGQLNVALKAKEIILKNFEDNNCDIESFFKKLSPNEIDNLAKIVENEINKGKFLQKR